MDVVWTLAGLVLAVLGAKFLVSGGTAVAKRFGIPSMVIGATVVAFGTSMPEFTVNIHSAVSGNTGLALGNILGSNLFNIAFILGVVALVKPLTVNADSAAKDLPMCLISALVIVVAGNDIFLDHGTENTLARAEGIGFMMFFAITMYYTYREAQGGATHKRTTHTKKIDEDHEARGLSLGMAVVYVVGGLAGLVFGGEFIVDGAQGIAKSFGLSDRLIGLLIVGPGTSVPELIASIVAARAGNVGMVIGNVLGSNMFNVFFTLGTTSIITTIPVDGSLNLAVISNVIITALVVLWVSVFRRSTLGRPVGAVLLGLYLVYIGLSIQG